MTNQQNIDSGNSSCTTNGKNTKNTDSSSNTVANVDDDEQSHDNLMEIEVPIEAYNSTIYTTTMDSENPPIIDMTKERDNDDDDNDNDDEDDENNNKQRFEIGDHVYHWCSVLGVPRVYSHHGIVVNVEPGWVTIVDFYYGLNDANDTVEQQQQEEDDKYSSGDAGSACVCPITKDNIQDPVIDPTDGTTYEKSALMKWVEENGTSPTTRKPLQKEQILPNRALLNLVGGGKRKHKNNNSKKKTRKLNFIGQKSIMGGSSNALLSSIGGRNGTFAKVTIEESIALDKWRKVKYGVKWSERLMTRSGTCSSVDSDTVGFVLSRVEFLWNNQHLVPPYHVTNCNCECVAFWCKTGAFTSIQAANAIQHAGGVFVGSAAGMGVRASASSVPAAGFMGWFGYTVPLTTAMPWVMPAIMAYGVASTAVSVKTFIKCKEEWTKTTNTLNDVFVEYNLRGEYLPHYSSVLQRTCS